MQVSLIAAMSQNQVIGRNNKLPWHLAADWENFKKVTANKPFIMGRKSYESEDMLYADLINIVLTRQNDYVLPEKFEAANNLKLAFERLAQYPEIFVLGGQKVFTEALPLATKLYLTIVPQNVKGDTFFPKVNWQNWRLTASKWVSRDDKNEFGHYINEFVRKL